MAIHSSAVALVDHNLQRMRTNTQNKGTQQCHEHTCSQEHGNQLQQAVGDLALVTDVSLLNATLPLPSSNHSLSIGSPTKPTSSPHSLLPSFDTNGFLSSLLDFPSPDSWASNDKPASPTVTKNAPKRQRGRFSTVDSISKHALRTKARHAQQRQQAAHAPLQTPNASAREVDDTVGKIRARNRQAAHRCRQKKQKGTAELQARESVASDMNKRLNHEAACLRSEVLMLKHMVLQHSNCGSTYIDKYVSSTAQSFGCSAFVGTRASRSVATEGEVKATSYTNSEVFNEDYIDWSMYVDCSMLTDAEVQGAEDE